MPKEAQLRKAREALDELEREMDVRSRIYRKWVQEGRLTKTDATDRYERHLSAVMLVRHVLAGLPVEHPDSIDEFVPPWSGNGTDKQVNKQLADDDVPF